MPFIDPVHIAQLSSGAKKDQPVVYRHLTTGPVLVIERRRCLGKVTVWPGFQIPCGRVYDVPSRELLQGHRSPADRAKYSMEKLRPDPRTDTVPPIMGKYRTIYIEETTCESCEFCFGANISWDDLTALPVPATINGEPVTLAPPSSFNEVRSRRDTLAKQLDEAERTVRKAKASLEDTQSQYAIACAELANLSRYQQVMKQFHLSEENAIKYVNEVDKHRPRSTTVTIAQEDGSEYKIMVSKDATPLTVEELI